MQDRRAHANSLSSEIHPIANSNSALSPFILKSGASGGGLSAPKMQFYAWSNKLQTTKVARSFAPCPSLSFLNRLLLFYLQHETRNAALQTL